MGRDCDPHHTTRRGAHARQGRDQSCDGVCPICFNAKKLDEGQLVANARLAGATPLWQWIGEGSATVFSY